MYKQDCHFVRIKYEHIFMTKGGKKTFSDNQNLNEKYA